MVRLHIWLKPFRFVTSESGFRNVAQMELKSPVMSGYDCSSGQKTPKPELLSGRLNVRFMVQFRKSHPDEHYAAALFRYMREFSVQYRTVTEMVCLDDKHRMKVGEPGYPVAAVERGRRVLVKVGTSFEVADHDFTKFSLIPSVALQNTIPDDITGSWYRGKVFVTLKEAAFEASSPMRHMAELSSILASQSCDKKVLMIYTDGGPDHTGLPVCSSGPDCCF